MSLSINELKLLRYINNKNIKINDLASDNQMSTRNIRYKIENINFYLNKYIKKKIIVENGIIKINILEDEEKKLFDLIGKSILRFDKEERQEIIINMYLFERNITLSKIEKTLFVTRTTLNKDIKDINNKIKDKNIKLDFVGKKINLVGNEKKLRHYKAEQLIKYTELKEDNLILVDDIIHSTQIIGKMINEYLKALPNEEIKESINYIQKLLDVKFEKGFYKIIFLYLMVTVERVNSNYIITKKNNEQFLKNLKQYKILKESLNKIIPNKYKYEYLHLTEYFISGYSSKKFVQSEFAIAKFTKRILFQLEETLDISFKEESLLVEDIIEYLNPAMYRIKNNFTINEKLSFSSIDKNIYDCVNKICSANNYLLPELLREEEILYISSIIEAFLKYVNSKVISLNDLIGIISSNSQEVDIENLKKDLLNSYKHLLIEDV